MYVWPSLILFRAIGKTKHKGNCEMIVPIIYAQMPNYTTSEDF